MTEVMSDSVGSEQIEAYELVLAELLNVTPAEVRDVFTRRLAQEAAREFAGALRKTRDLRQPDGFAMLWAIEAVITRRRSEAGEDIEEMFNDPTFHKPPSEEAMAIFEGMWAERAPGCAAHRH